jgi:hypothetical protein
MHINDDINVLKKKLKELADVINSFKSEAVQLKIVELLFEGVEVATESIGEEKKPASKRRRRPKKLTKKEPKAKKNKDSIKQAKIRGTGKGSWVVVSKLVDEGFFDSPKAIREVIKHCSTNLGLHFKANEISPPLLRLLRDNKLAREKNKDNQYEYATAR